MPTSLSRLRTCKCLSHNRTMNCEQNLLQKSRSTITPDVFSQLLNSFLMFLSFSFFPSFSYTFPLPFSNSKPLLISFHKKSFQFIISQFLSWMHGMLGATPQLQRVQQVHSVQPTVDYMLRCSKYIKQQFAGFL